MLIGLTPPTPAPAPLHCTINVLRAEMLLLLGSQHPKPDRDRYGPNQYLLWKLMSQGALFGETLLVNLAAVVLFYFLPLLPSLFTA